MAPANQSKEGVLYLQIVFCFLFIIHIDIVIVTNITEFLVISLIYFHYSESPKTNRKKKKTFPEYYYRALWELRYLIHLPWF